MDLFYKMLTCITIAIVNKFFKKFIVIMQGWLNFNKNLFYWCLGEGAVMQI